MMLILMIIIVYYFSMIIFYMFIIIIIFLFICNFAYNMDVVSRLGGDEFAVFVGRDISPAEADGMLRRFMTVFHQNFDDKYPDQKLGTSIGASAVALSDTYELLYHNADKALYEAKWNGKDQFRIRN